MPPTGQAYSHTRYKQAPKAGRAPSPNPAITGPPIESFGRVFLGKIISPAWTASEIRDIHAFFSRVELLHPRVMDHDCRIDLSSASESVCKMVQLSLKYGFTKTRLVHPLWTVTLVDGFRGFYCNYSTRLGQKPYLSYQLWGLIRSKLLPARIPARVNRC